MAGKESTPLRLVLTLGGNRGEDPGVAGGLSVIPHDAAQELHPGRHLAGSVLHVDRAVVAQQDLQPGDEVVQVGHVGQYVVGHDEVGPPPLLHQLVPGVGTHPGLQAAAPRGLFPLVPHRGA